MSPAAPTRSFVSRLRRLARRGRRWFANRADNSSAVFFYGERYGIRLPDSTFDPKRGERILGFLLGEKLIGRSHVLQVTRPVSLRALRRVHTDEYLASLERPDALTGVVGFPLGEELHDAFLASQRDQVAGTCFAARTVIDGAGVAVNLGGGFHHALSDRGQGFCVFNDIAVAVASVRRNGFDAPILVVDLDLHDGDGTRRIFADDPSVHTFSIHNRTLDDRPAEASTTFALGTEVEDDAYLAAIRERLPVLCAGFEAGLAFYVAGVDPAHDDRLGDWRISAEGMLERDRLVMSALRGTERPIPTVIVLAGGYGSRSWRYSARFLSTLPHGGAPVEPPTTEQLRLAYYRETTRALRPTELTHEPGADWSLTEEDIDPGGTSRQRSRRFLGYYSRHGVELALEKSGLLDKIRQRGPDELRIEVQTDQPGEHTLVVRSGRHDDEPVLELRARVDRALVRGMALLWLEWLLLQNPGASFTPQRPRLPGQTHPGLGLLGDVSAILVLICERLELDGIAFVPSHFHIAAQAQSYFRFLDPVAQARFESIRTALGPRRLVDAIDRFERGEIVDRSTGEPVRWDPSPMVFPVSERLRERLDRAEFREALERARHALRLTLRPASGNDPQEA